MTTYVLVTYTTRYGSTQEVAEAIAATLREHGLKVEVQPASEIRTLEEYGAVVGSKREEQSDFRAKSDQSARRVSSLAIDCLRSRSPS